jgi:hypothetical protein
LENKFNYFLTIWKKKTLQKYVRKCKKIVGQPLLTVSYKKPLGKIFTLDFANDFL